MSTGACAARLLRFTRLSRSNTPVRTTIRATRPIPASMPAFALVDSLTVPAAVCPLLVESAVGALVVEAVEIDVDDDDVDVADALGSSWAFFSRHSRRLSD